MINKVKRKHDIAPLIFIYFPQKYKSETSMVCPL